MKFILHPEALRRLIAVLGVMVAVVLFLWPRPEVYRLNLEPEGGRKSMFGRELYGLSTPGVPLLQYQPNTRDDKRVVAVSGPEWEAVFRGLLADKKGFTPLDWLPTRYQVAARYPAYFYFEPGTEPLAQLAGRMDTWAVAAMEIDGKLVRASLQVSETRHDSNVPTWLVYPRRVWSWLPLVLGLVGYFFWPRERRPQGAITYSRLPAMVVPDFMALIGGGIFFGLPLLIIPDIAGNFWEAFNPLGAMWFSFFFWLPGMVFASILAVGAWYGSLWFLPLPDRLERSSLLGRGEYPYADMEEMHPYTRRPPKWLVPALLIAGRGSPLATGQALMLTGSKITGLEISLRSGGRLRIGADALDRMPEIVEALEKGGVSWRVEETEGDQPDGSPGKTDDNTAS